jgi:hypothetical protein
MSLEIVVRPVVLPNIRPSVARRIAPPDDPTKGLASLGGGGAGTFIGVSESYSHSISKQEPHKETKRQVDTDRVYQMDENGNINKSNFVDIERITKLLSEANDGGAYSTLRSIYHEPNYRPNVETIETGKTIKSSG